MERGLLASMYFSDDPSADLKTYVGTYLQQEILAEGATRNLPAFSRFLKAASHCNSRIVNFTNAASDAQVARTTVYEYFKILKDTLVIHEVPAWNKSIRRKPLASSKYYFFDVGVAGALQGRMFRMETPEFGEAFETLIFQELAAWSDYQSGERVEFWRTKTGFEVNFVLGGHTAIEVKSGSNVANIDLKSLRAIIEENKLKRHICVCREHLPRKIGEIDVMPYETFLDALWNVEFTT